MAAHTHRTLSTCPVCAGQLAVTRLGCPSCGTEIVGQFTPCPFCALDAADLDLLLVFLASRGNLKELEKHLGVSYPTARARFSQLLVKLGLQVVDAESDADPEDAPQHADPLHTTTDTGSDDADSESVGDPADEPHRVASGNANAVRDQVLAQVASGALAPDVAADLLARLG